MKYDEVKQDLFTVSEDYCLAHCISSDYALSAGIAKEFNKKYDMSFKLNHNYPITDANISKALLVDNVFNLVTKQRYFHKPTYISLLDSLVDMREQCEKLNIKKLAMPKIASGLDKLDWEQVKVIIEDVFKDTDIEILVCYL